ncbi:MAG TPA: arginase family protein, partial [Candidatus Eisenbacteria bacterium]|nr:arginase family protein [Candidatus Eisenbacteria bacterium]
MATIAILGSPTALGGHFGGMEHGPRLLREAGLIDLLVGRPGLAGQTLVDHGDVPNDPGWAADDDPRAKNRALIAAYLPRLAEHVERTIRAPAAGAVDERDDSAEADARADRPRLLILGGDCTSHAGALAGLKRAQPDARYGIAWFDAHGDFNTPDTTPSGNVWGMPFAMLLGRGDADLVDACDGPTVLEEDAALLGGQVLDEQESRMLAASRVSHFGAGMLGT